MGYTLIETRDQLIDFSKFLHNQKIATIGMDFEAEYNLHENGERLCLIQVNARNDLFLIDPFPIDDDEIRKILESRTLLKVFFDVSSDAALVRRQYGAQLGPALDLSIVGQCVGINSGGLASLLESFLGIKISKKSKFQKYNWTRRPLDHDAIDYALEDVRYLIQLKDIMLSKLADPQRIEQVIRAHLNQCSSNRRIGRRRAQLENKIAALSPEEKARYEAVDRIRDGFAKIVNKPKNQILANDVVFALATDQIQPSGCALTKVLSKAQQQMLLTILEKEINDSAR